VKLDFTIFPAIDLRRGRVVRLIQGRADNEIIYSDDPAETARRWQSDGATWLHIVNLDGAFGDPDNLNAAALENILSAVNLPIQFGGGLRDLPAMQRAFDLGVQRIILGTVALEQPEIVSDAVNAFGAARVIVAIESREGNLATRGWLGKSNLDAITFGKQMRARGISQALVTDIARDGMLQGIDAQAMAKFARATELQVIAAGGVASLTDIDNLLSVASAGVNGVNIGQALYTGAFTLPQALARVSQCDAQHNEPKIRTRKPRYCEG
jgi:phosphoribosylformimino-5-aminoimidazole carboxamide ribotide isomerase